MNRNAIERVIIKRTLRGADAYTILLYIDHLKCVWKYSIPLLEEIETNFLQSLDKGFVLWYPLDKSNAKQEKRNAATNQFQITQWASKQHNY